MTMTRTLLLTAGLALLGLTACQKDTVVSPEQSSALWPRDDGGDADEPDPTPTPEDSAVANKTPTPMDIIVNP